MVRKAIHNWTKEDQILAYFNAVYGIDQLIVSNEQDLARYVIGTSAKSLQMTTSNFRYVLDLEGSQLEHASEIQFDIAAEMTSKSLKEVKEICNEIILQSDYKQMVSEDNVRNWRKQRVVFKAESEERLQQELNRHKVHGKSLTKIPEI